jgi:hypothetical protein
MNKLGLLIGFLFAMQLVTAQTDSTSATADTVFLQFFGAASGFETASSGQTITFSMGELFVSTESNFGQTFTQGFQQGDLFQVLDVVSLSDVKFDVSVYPNPTSSHLHVTVETTKHAVYGKDYVVELYDLVGKKLDVSMQYIDSKTLELDVHYLPTGAYIAKVYGIQNANWVSSFKVTKVAGE